MRSFFALLILAALAIGAYYLIDVDITTEARLPDVDVKVADGRLPEAEVKTGSVNLTQQKVKVTVPQIDVRMVEKDITIPGLEFHKPSDDTASAN